jgi:hypothetical protein
MYVHAIGTKIITIDGDVVFVVVETIHFVVESLYSGN